MSSIRVGVITYDWYLYEPRVRRLSEAAAIAYSVDVICVRQPGEKRHEVRDGVHIYRMPMSRVIGRSLPVTVVSWYWFLLLAGATVTWLHLKKTYHVIHVHNMPDFLVFSALFPRFLGAKVILDVQDASPELMAAKATGRLRGVKIRLARWQERISTAFADHVITSGWLFEKLLLQRRVARDKLTVIINSADPRLFPESRRTPPPAESSNASAESFILMYHGTLAKRCGLEIAIRAVALARSVVPNVRLVIKGRGEQLPIIKNLTAQLGVSDIVKFSASGPVEEVVDFILQGHVGIIPYQCDGFTELLLPTKAYEFAWMHRPMIASDTIGIRSMFRPESILLCDPTSPESFTEAIIALYHNPEKRARMATNAAEDYTPYRWELMAKRYQELLASLCRKQE